MTSASTITEAQIRAFASARSFERGRKLYRDDGVLRLVRRGDRIYGEVRGTEEPS